jgi:hypothetical protein
MQIMNTLATLASSTSPAEREALLGQLRAEYAKIDDAARNSDVGRAATIVIQADEIARLKAAAQAPAQAPAPAPSPGAQVTVTPNAKTVVYKNTTVVPAAAGTTIYKDGQVEAIAFPTKEDASRAIVRTMAPEAMAVDPAMAYVLYGKEATRVANNLISEGSLLVPVQEFEMKWYHYLAIVLGTVAVGAVAYYVLNREEAEAKGISGVRC